MRKFIALFAAAVVLFAASGCGGCCDRGCHSYNNSREGARTAVAINE
jgi:hypothetical protein